MNWSFFKIRKRLTKEDLIEQDKQRLIWDLETKGIKHLINKMKSRVPFSKLILEKQKKGSYSSTDYESCYAYQQSQKLNTRKDKEELLLLLDNKDYSEYKIEIYSCLSHICTNTNDIDLFNFLIDRVENEEEINLKKSILSRLGKIKKSRSTNIKPIINILNSGSLDLRYAAIEALYNTDEPEVEDLLLKIFKTNNRDVKFAICRPLETTGTLKAIPVLKDAFKHTRDGGLRLQIENTIEKIENKKATTKYKQ